MKQKLLWVVTVALLLCVGCNREERKVMGDYSYKLSGEVLFADNNGHGSRIFIRRNGQMNVLKDKSRPHGLMITMNEMNGGCYTFPALMQGDSIMIEPHNFPFHILSTDGLPSLFSDSASSFIYHIEAAGSGRSNDNVLIIKEHWMGTQSGNASITLRTNEMTILAEKN